MSRNNQIRQNLCDLLWRQNSVGETNIFTQILQYTRSGCRWDVSLPLADLPVHSDWSVAATFSLVSSDLKHSLYRLFSLVTAKCSASVTGNPSIAFFSSMRDSKIQYKHHACFLVTTLTIIVTLCYWSTTLHYHGSTVPPPSTITVPLFHHPVLSLFHHPLLSLFHCSTTLYYHWSTVPPPFTITVPLFDHPVLSLFHCSTTRYYHSSTIPSPFTITVTLCHFSIVSSPFCITVWFYYVTKMYGVFLV